MDELDKKYDSYFTVEYALRLAERGFKDSDDEDDPSGNSEASDSTDPLLVAVSDFSDISDSDSDDVAPNKVDCDIASGNLDDVARTITSKVNTVSVNSNIDNDDDDYDD
jgi:hypothetical protein